MKKHRSAAALAAALFFVAAARAAAQGGDATEQEDTDAVLMAGLAIDDKSMIGAAAADTVDALSSSGANALAGLAQVAGASGGAAAAAGAGRAQQRAALTRIITADNLAAASVFPRTRAALQANGIGIDVTNLAASLRADLRSASVVRDPEGRELIREAFSVLTREQVRSVVNAALNNIPPERLLYLGLQARRVGKRELYAADFVLSDGSRGLDVALQPFIGRNEGIGAAVRIDLSTSRRPLARSVASAQDAATAAREVVGSARALADTLLFSKDVLAAFVDNAFAVKASTVLDYRSFSQQGSVLSVRLVTSRLLRLNPDVRRRSAGITPLLSAQFAEFRPPHRGGVRTGVRPSVAVFYQDRVPRVDALNEQIDGAIVTDRWRYQIGYEYSFDNAFDDTHYHTAVVRYRLASYGELTYLFRKGAGRGETNLFSLGRSFRF